MSISTPWGFSDQTQVLLEGVISVIGEQKNGLMVSTAAAQRLLSDAACKRSFKHGDYLCFDGDSDYLIPLYDAKEHRRALCAASPFLEGKNDVDLELYLHRELSSSNPDYLLEVGVQPDRLLHEAWLDKQKVKAARARKCPDLIVRCLGDTNTLAFNVLEVETADGKTHLVTRESYSMQQLINASALYVELSTIEQVAATSLPAIEDRVVPYLKFYADDFYRGYAGNIPRAVEALRLKVDRIKPKFMKLMAEHHGTSAAVAETIYRHKLIELRGKVHSELQDCPVFTVKEETTNTTA